MSIPPESDSPAPATPVEPLDDLDHLSRQSDSSATATPDSPGTVDAQAEIARENDGPTVVLPLQSALTIAASSGNLITAVGAGRATTDIAVQIISRVGNLLLGVVATAVLARGLGEYGFGQWTTILLVPGLLGYLNSLGFSQVAIRRATAENDSRWLGALVSARAALSIPVTLLCIVVIVIVAHGDEMLLAGIIVASQGFLAAPIALESIFQTQVRNHLPMLAMTINSVLWTLAIILIARAHGGLVPYAIAMGTVATFTTALQAAAAIRSVRLPLRGTHRLWRQLARTAVPLSIGSLLIVAYGRIDSLIVYLSAGTGAAGLYNTAYRVVEQMGFVPISLVTTLMPVVSRLLPSRPDVARRLLQLALDVLAMFSLPAFAFALVASRPAIRLVFGSNFDRAAPALPVLMGAFVFVCCGYALGVFTLVLGLQRQFARFALIALVFNVIANLLLVPRYGFMAAAWTTVATELLVSGLIGRKILNHLQMRLSIARIARIATAATLSGVVTLILLHAGVGVVALLGIAIVIHIAGLFALRAVSVGEIRALLRRDPIGAL